MVAAQVLGTDLLGAVVRAAQEAGERVRAEFFRPSGPRGARGKAPIDTEIEEVLRATLQSLLDCSFLGEETGLAPGSLDGYRWVVDPHDGTTEFLKGNRGSAVSIALLRGEGLTGAAPGTPLAGAQAVLGVVHCPLAPDRGEDTIAWAQGCGPIRRDGAAIAPALAQGRLEHGALVWTTASAALRPQAFSRALVPARYVALPSIAYRLARIAAGDGVATLSLHSVNEYDIAAGAALVRAAGGVMHDSQGRDIAFTGAANALVPGCIAGAPEAVRALAGKDWEGVLREPKLVPRIALGFPRGSDEMRLARAQACLLGLVIGSQAPEGELSGDGELALALARAIAREKRYDAGAAVAASHDWQGSRAPGGGSAPGSALLRAAPIGIWAVGDPARAARAAREDALAMRCEAAIAESCAGSAAAIATGIAGGALADMQTAARAHCGSAAHEAIERSFRLLREAQDFEQILIAAAAAPGERRAIAGALFGALHGRAAIPPRRLLPVLAWRPCAESGAPQPRPMAYWPDDLLELAEALIAA